MKAETYTVTFLSEASGLDRRLVKTILRPLGDANRYTLRQFLSAVRQHFASNVQTAREERAANQAALLKLELLERTDELVPWPVMWWLLENILLPLRTQLAHLGDRLSYERRDPSLGEWLDKQVREVLHSLSSGNIAYPIKGTPKNFEPEFVAFLERLVAENAAAKTLHEIQTRLEKYDDYSDTTGAGDQETGESQSGTAPADMEPESQSEAPGDITGATAPAGSERDPSQNVDEGLK
ncbi:MAG TPA: hypothetical protein VJA21_01135 [Verrucomicrobiae bacterium]